MTILNLIILVGALGVFFIVLEMVRRRTLREEYSLLWLLASFIYLVAALWPKSITFLAELIGVSSPVMAILFVGINFLILILIQFSIRLSRLTDRFKDLTQQIAIIDHELGITTRDLFRINRANKSYFYVLAASISARENYSRATIETRVRLNRILASHLGWSQDQIESLEFATILHDIGKINIPISALYKTSQLSDDDWQRIKEHPMTSVSILEGIPFLLASIPMIQYHHEHWDGTGYPEGLKGDEIPEGARILGLADAFVALISNRPYRQALTLEEAAEVLRDQSGKQFDPKIIEAMFECWDEVTTIIDPSDIILAHEDEFVTLDPTVFSEKSLIEPGLSDGFVLGSDESQPSEIPSD